MKSHNLAYKAEMDSHRNQIKFLIKVIRDGRCHKPSMTRLIKSHMSEMAMISKRFFGL